ncbi:MAG: restriction endonuclease subunit S [Candidatus Kapabacteria bacterium]|nr:restriction endonuclease subunit S [Candidatus Kapabacteria bacterium]
MNYIEQMVAELCPNGVEFRELGTLVEKATTIRWQDVEGEEFQYIDLTSVDRTTHAIGDTEIITSEDAPSRAQQIVHADDVIFGTTRPMLKRYCRIPAEYHGQVCSSGYCVLRAKTKWLLPNFLFHLIGTESFYDYVDANQRGASYPAITDGAVKAFRFPIPPLPIQQEIVRVLDLFMALLANLQAELVARRKQYQYYRDQLLSFEGRKDVRWGTLGEMFDMRAGHHISAQNIIAEPDQSHLYPCFGGNGVRGFVEKFSHDGAYLLIGRQGALCGNVQRARGKFYATEHAVVVTASAEINVDWAFHMLTLMNLNQYASKSAQPGLAVGKLAELRIAVPPLAEQEEIAGILDKFDALVNDLCIGLPAEIAARQKQYEYYRDRLLTFPEAAPQKVAEGL